MRWTARLALSAATMGLASVAAMIGPTAARADLLCIDPNSNFVPCTTTATPAPATTAPATTLSPPTTAAASHPGPPVDTAPATVPASPRTPASHRRAARGWRSFELVAFSAGLLNLAVGLSLRRRIRARRGASRSPRPAAASSAALEAVAAPGTSPVAAAPARSGTTVITARPATGPHLTDLLDPLGPQSRRRDPTTPQPPSGRLAGSVAPMTPPMAPAGAEIVSNAYPHRRVEAKRAPRTGAEPLASTIARPAAPAATMRGPADAVTVLVVFVVLLVGIPSRLVVKQLGAQATPALLLGLLMLLWWACARMIPGMVDRKRQPMRLALGVFGASIVMSYGIGFLHHLEGIQSRSADRGILLIGGLAGVALLAMDGIETRAGLDRVLKVLVVMASISAALGILAFFLGIYPVNQIHIPGLSANGPLTFVGGRSRFRRVAGTSQHPLEFGILLAVVLPIAMHYAFWTPKPHNRRWWICTILIGLALPMALSRAAIIGTILVLALLFPTWPPRRRNRTLALIPVYALGMHVLVPGLIGTFKNLFTQASTDNSITHRTNNYARIGTVMRHHWLFGTGFGTYVPIRFDQVLDNAYLGHLFDTGVVGLLCLLLLFWAGFFTARGARRRCHDPSDRDLCQSLTASVAVVIPGFFTFDAFAYSMATAAIFLILGCCGAAWRLAKEGQAEALAAVAREH